MALESKNPVSSIYEASLNSDDEGINIIEKLSTDIDEQNLITNKITISQLINCLEEREKQIILLRYYRGKTQTEIASILGISQVQVSRIEKRALKKLARALDNATS